jgi:hypothetical protein
MKSNGHYVDLPPEGWSFIGDHKIVAPKMLVKGVLPFRGIAFIGGQSGAGKTFIADDLATALGSATPFFGRAVKERVGVAILAAEGADQAGNRLTAAARGRGLKIGDLPIAWRGGAPLKTADDVDAIGKQLLELGEHIRQQYGVRLGVSIIDTVAATFDMEDEDRNSEVARAIRKMRDLGDKFEGLVIPIHHYGKSAATGLRGGSAWRAGADVVLSVIAERNELTGKVSGRELALAKSRDGIEGPIAPFDLTFAELGTDDDGDPFGTLVVTPADGPCKMGTKMRLTDRQKLALTALANCTTVVDRGKPVPTGLPRNAVEIEEWRNEVFARGVLDPNGSNPRADFKRLNEGLQARSLIGCRDGLVWSAAGA